ncbi:ATP-dependent DNA helicase MER3 homolog isoform X2 [Sorghum bicolor]|uniref:ATP-dependent DNA helicase MER3 homolog isoform X2 n=1 Tax=Sorghum bicolor TaxID=4558 RepID=UPI0007F23764|nr:ATP-dependent DNA helicase MER3 homolog isoform X2 [Sorghum bicolor]|eukprot:XP_021313849.1 ATP-dependent DNA helicase MER3 homolog isoform X2 [Sorghum bicolor]
MGSLADPYALRCVSDLPPPFRSVFRYFNSLQSECFHVCFFSDVNMVISAPTGSGKTVLFELCILRLLSRFLSPDWRFNLNKGTLKTIYIAPSKALVQEKLRDWNMKLGPLGINCLEMTGDSEFYNNKAIHDADLILTTPEKFDSMSRHGIKGGRLGFFSDIALVLIDEVHLLNDPRGAALEAVVSRIKMLSRNDNMKSFPLANVRFIAVSATIPNIEDIAQWLLAPPEGIKRFGEEMRPVKLTTKVFGYAPAKNDFLFERRLQSFIYDILMQHSRGKSALIFCSTRKGAQEAAQCLSQTGASLGYSNPFMKSMQQYEHLKEASLTCSDKQLQACIVHGVGFHNGGLCLKDRGLVEGLFLKGDLQVLCTTNTLAHGINLPAHTVVIKSTQFFNKEKGLYVEYERSMVLQMCGRAGRAPFDDTGTIIIMTRKETVHLYENLLNGCEMVESQLLPCAVEHLNAEIVQLTVSDIILAVEWIKCSYLYTRIRKNPENYGVKRGTPQDLLEKQIQDICVQKIHELVDYGLILTDEGAFVLQPLEPGRLMAKFYLKFDTMKLIVKASASCSMEDLLHVICHSAEITWIQLRRKDKKILNDINADKDGRLLFHIVTENGKRKKRVQTREEKIFLLANDCLTGDPLIHDLSLNQETNSICSNGCRIAKCMREYFIYKKNYRSAINSMILANSLHQKLWESSPFLLKQLPGIGIVTAKALKTAGIHSFETLATADARKIELATGRNYQFGNHIKESMSSLPPKIDIDIEETGNRFGKTTITVTLTRLSQAVPSSKRSCADMVVASEEDNVILFHENIRTREFHSPYSVKVFVPCPQNARVTLKVDLIFEGYVGLDVHKKHVVSREDGLYVTKEHVIDKLEPAYNLPSEICLVSSRTTRTSRSQSYTEQSPLSKEVYVIEDDGVAVSALEKADNVLGTRKFNNLASLEVPNFDLLPEEEYGAASAPGPEQAECKSATDNTIFDHIRKKSKEFPTLMVSKSMDSSYEPLILKKMKISRDQFEVEHGCLHADEATTLDFEPVEPRVSLTNTAEKCRGILGRSSEKSRMLFGIMDSPSEKSTMLSTTPDKSSLRNAGGKESPLEKSKVLSTSAENSLQFAVRGVNSSEKSKMLTTPDKSSLVSAGGKESPLEKSEVVSTSAENSLQFAARHVNSSENSKMLTTPDKSSLVFAGGKDSPLEKSKILISTPVEYPLKKGNPGENPFKTGTPVENSPQFAAQCDSPSKKRKSCISSPLPCLQAVQCIEQVRAAGQPFDIQEYVKEISRSRKNSQGGDPFAGYKSIFSFLY